ncbi:MAG: alkaline phosphatase family protein [Acidimicrobiales bacterium]
MVTAEAQRDDQDEQYVRPDYDGACITNLVPALLEWPQPPSWLPAEAHRADQVVLLVLDGLGWCQLQEHGDRLPTLRSLAGGPITTVAPSTTAAALTSIATGLPPGEHGVVGYRVRLDDDVVNMLRWTSERGDARNAHPPSVVQPHEAFCGQRPAIVTRAEFSTTGFTQAHLAGARFHGYRVLSTLVAQVVELVRAGEPFVYAYYEGIDKVAHEYGLGDYYRAELHTADHLVAWLLEELPAGTAGHRGRPRPGGDGRQRDRAPQAGAGQHVGAVGGGPLPLAARPAGARRCAVRIGPAPPRRPRLGPHPRRGARRAVVRAEGQRGARRAPGRRVPGGQGHRRLPRPGGHRAVPVDRAARFAHRGGDAGAAAGRSGALNATGWLTWPRDR